MNRFEFIPKVKRILIVDDAVENLKLLSALLQDDYQVRVAKDGQQAIDYLHKYSNIDLILMDVMMPKMDGFTACVQIKSNPEWSQIPVIFITALNDVDDETHGLECGGADFISKPFNTRVVKARIRNHLALREERMKSDTLLRFLLPNPVINELKLSGSYTPEIHTNTSIMFCDLVGFTSITERLSPEDLVDELSEVFTAFDELIKKHKGMRIKTIGDGYMAATGIGTNGSEHADHLVSAGLEMITYLKERNRTADQEWLCRIGIHSGQVISGIVGKSRCQFDIMGDDVNIAARVENNGIPMQLTITDATAQLLSDKKYLIQSQGEVSLKGKGRMHLSCVRRRDDSA